MRFVNWALAVVVISTTAALVVAGAGTGGTIATTVDVSGATTPAPGTVYQSYASAAGGVGNKLVYTLPVQDGTYSLRLHFAEPSVLTVGGRKFDIVVNGATQVTDYDIFVAAGNQRYKATVVELAGLAATGGTGVTLELVNKVSTAVLAGLELWTANAGGAADPTVDLEVSHDGGGTWAPIATDVALDRFGRGTFTWTVTGPETDSALIRVTNNPADTSDAAFQIANSGAAYYVNIAGDTDFADNEYTTAPGANTNSGKRPDAPMASLTALVRAYDLDPDDVVYADTGAYLLFANVGIGAADAGVRFHGAEGAGHATLLNRGNTNVGSYAFTLNDADGTTLEYLTLFGAYDGVYVYGGSDGVTIQDSEVRNHARYGLYDTAGNITLLRNRVHDNAAGGIYLTSASTAVSDNVVYNNNTTDGIYLANQTGVAVLRNVVYGNTQEGIEVAGSNSTVSDNTVYANTRYGIYTSGPGFTVSGNTAYANDWGLYAYNSLTTEAPTVVTANVARDNVDRGIQAAYNVRVEGNTVYGQDGTDDYGIGVTSNAVAQDNEVFGNTLGISAGGNNNRGDVVGNRVYNNQTTGILAYTSSDVRNNVVFSNTVGILAALNGAAFTGEISGNLVYDCADQGILVKGAAAGAAGRGHAQNRGQGWGDVGGHDALVVEAGFHAGAQEDHRHLRIVVVWRAVARAGGIEDPVRLGHDHQVRRPLDVIAIGRAPAHQVPHQLPGAELLTRVDARDVRHAANRAGRRLLDFGQVQPLPADQLVVEIRRRTGLARHPLALAKTRRERLLDLLDHARGRQPAARQVVFGGELGQRRHAMVGREHNQRLVQTHLGVEELEEPADGPIGLDR